MKFITLIIGSTVSQHKRNEDILEELKIHLTYL